MRHLHPKLEAELDGSGLPWRFEQGARHIKLFVCDRLVMVLSSKGWRPGDSFASDGKSYFTARSRIRRAIRQAKTPAAGAGV